MSVTLTSSMLILLLSSSDRPSSSWKWGMVDITKIHIKHLIHVQTADLGTKQPSRSTSCPLYNTIGQNVQHNCITHPPPPPLYVLPLSQPLQKQSVHPSPVHSPLAVEERRRRVGKGEWGGRGGEGWERGEGEERGERWMKNFLTCHHLPLLSPPLILPLTLLFSLASRAPNLTVAMSICSSSHFLTSAFGPSCGVCMCVCACVCEGGGGGEGRWQSESTTRVHQGTPFLTSCSFSGS